MDDEPKINPPALKTGRNALKAKARSLSLVSKTQSAALTRLAAKLNDFIFPPGATVADVQNRLNQFDDAASAVRSAKIFSTRIDAGGNIFSAFPPSGWRFTTNADGKTVSVTDPAGQTAPPPAPKPATTEKIEGTK